MKNVFECAMRAPCQNDLMCSDKHLRGRLVPVPGRGGPSPQRHKRGKRLKMHETDGGAGAPEGGTGAPGRARNTGLAILRDPAATRWQYQ